MSNHKVRLTNISIQNFKNVINGELNLTNSRREYNASILGLYGQNGSGKTALIDAVQLLKYVLCGMPIPKTFADYINVGSDYAAIKYTFDILTTIGKYKAFYELYIKNESDEIANNMEVNVSNYENYKTTIYHEVLSYSFENDKERIRKSPLIDTDSTDVFVPAKKYECLLGKDKKQETDLLVAKKIAVSTSRSFVFSKELMTAIRKRRVKGTEFQRHLTLMEKLVAYGNFELFIINTSNAGMISMNTLPLAFKYEDKNTGTMGNMVLPLETSVPVPKAAVQVIEKIIGDMNVVLTQIIPGLTISIKNLGSQVLSNGEMANNIQFMSNKNSKEIPLKYESEGIKKIISVLHLLIVLYNQPSITVAIDELDSGIFEYLLGEILRIISEKGKGQLIFTSHNLRPLETLDKGFIAFTTTNPSKRYIRLSNIKENNNLRDFYFRDIVLGEQSEELYSQTNNAEIALAFREAGETCGS